MGDHMYKETYKKFVTFGIVLAFLGLIIIPAINAGEINTENINKVFNKVILKSSWQSRLENINSDCDLLIVTADEFAELLQPLKTHKDKYGVKTNIVTLSYVYQEIDYGYDKPEKIKYFIKNAVEESGVKYVLLVGNFRKMPIRYVYNDEPWPHFPEPYFISELYYADIYDSEGNFSSWDPDGNGIYGEWNGDEAQDKDIDLYPDVYVGRLACRFNIEVRIMVNKIIAYETKTYDKDWFKKVTVVAGDTYPDGQYSFPTPEYEGEVNSEMVLENMSHFEPVRLFTSDGSFSGPEDVINAINNGTGFIAFDGHAGPRSWATHKPNSSQWVEGLKNENMIYLRNRNMLPICVAGACHNAQFDTNLLNFLIQGFETALNHGTWSPECWGWKLTRKIGGGTIATIANTGLGMTKEDKTTREGAGDYMDAQFFYVYGNNLTDILGEVWGIAIGRYLDAFPIDWNTPSGWDFSYDAKTVQQWVLLGDPSLKIGGYPPQ